MNERYESINQLRFVYHNANDVCILHTFDILIIIMVVLKMLCDQKKKFGRHELLFALIHQLNVNVYLCYLFTVDVQSRRCHKRGCYAPRGIPETVSSPDPGSNIRF